MNLSQESTVCNFTNTKRPTVWQLVGMFAILIYVGYILKLFGILNPEIAVSSGIGLGAVFVMGLVAAASSCIAVSGGLLLSSVATFEERYGATRVGRLKAVGQFIAGRLLSYGLLGALIGYLGQSFVPSPAVLGAVTFLAALYMFVMGLNMLHLTPKWLKVITPTVPKKITQSILKAENRQGMVMPFLLGAATFFLPCGFTQALQLYALTTGNAFMSGMILFVFALGTAPSLFLLGYASGSLKGTTGQWFYRFSGALVILLGIWNMTNAATIAGISLPSVSISSSSTIQDPNDDTNVVIEDGVQVIRMKLTSRSPYYSPSDHYTVQSGMPVRIEINGQGGGCRTVFQIPKYGVSQPLVKEKNIIEFTPQGSGEAIFSCSMGMYRGTLTVI